jgi:phosphoserine aminotransferase
LSVFEMSDRIYNFAAGPATLPEPVMEQAREELCDYGGTGMSAMELPHRAEPFKSIAAQAETDLRDLLSIPDDYAVLFMQGGARLHAAALAMNLAAHGSNASYVDTGHWSAGAAKAAAPYISVTNAGTAQATAYQDIVSADEWHYNEAAAYLHYVANETIAGVQYHDTPECGVPLVSDMTSELLSRPLDVSRFGLIYAGAQKNIGPAGMTVVIGRRDMLGHALDVTPGVLNYQLQDEARSMLNTPPTWCWYIAGLTFEWLKRQGGLSAMEKSNRSKAARLYAAIDDSEFYRNAVAVRARSRMNVPFTLAEPALDKTFLTEAAARGLKNLKGHRTVGGMRASIYNAMPEAGVEALVDFMHGFEQQHG